MNKAGAIYPFSERSGYSVSRGERHGLVMIIQIMLDSLSLYHDELGGVVMSGSFDLATENAVRSFQKSNMMIESGRVDLETWNRLAEEFNAVIKENQ